MTPQPNRPTDPSRATGSVRPVPLSEEERAYVEQQQQASTAYVVSPRGRRANGPGVWVTMLVCGLFALILVGVAVLLPPISLLDRLFGPQYVRLDAANSALASADGQFTLYTDPEAAAPFDLALDVVPLETALGGGWDAAAMQAAPMHAALQSTVITLARRGAPSTPVRLTLSVPEDLNSTDDLDVWGWYAREAAWRFLPSQPTTGQTALLAEVPADALPDAVALFQGAPQPPVVLVSVDVSQVLSDEVASLATIVAPAGMTPTASGALSGSLAAGFRMNAGYLVMPVVRNYTDPRALDADTISALLADPTLRLQHAAQVAAFANSYHGVFLDYRGLPAERRDDFSAFVTTLGASLRAQGLGLGVVVPAARPEAGRWDTGAYDWRALGAAADFLHVDLATADPAMFAPGEDRLVEAMTRWGVGETSRTKLLLGLSTQSLRQAEGTLTPISYAAALSALGDVQVSADRMSSGQVVPGATIRAQLDGLRATVGEDAASRTPYIDYYADGSDSAAARVWLTTADALRWRMERTLPFALGGVAFTDLLADATPDALLRAVGTYKMQLPGTLTGQQLALRWTISGAGGETLGEVTTGLNEALNVTITAAPGDYAINVAVVGAQGEAPRGGVAVALANPTATPTPLPSPTPTPTPSPTPDVAAIAAAQARAASGAAAAPGGGGQAAVRPGAGSIVGGFEYGGHVTDAASGRAHNAARQAGMTWLKIQVRYGSNDYGPQIAAGRAAGFKVLVGTVGSPGDVAAGGDGYFQSYANWLGQVAAAGPDAIEIWNEPNIDREWPAGQISGANYTRLLAASYNAIKAANPSVMVISGALAPTGAEAAFPGRVVNDDNFLRDMVNNGALNVMDCVGLHYNEGIVPPSQTSGDPRGDNYYTRYLPTMISMYAGITGGARPICITELGYVSPEGFPPLSPFWSWGQNTTVAQQAAWLAGAAAVSSQSGQVRLMIVWNVDFTFYSDGDPMAGYAIIRPDGSCPACSAMAGAR